MLHRYIVLAGVALAVWARAGQVEVIASRDATLFEQIDGDLANGAGIHAFSGRTLHFGERRALFYFDVASAVPAGSEIMSAMLVLSVSRSVGGEYPVYIHRALGDWGEGASDSGDPGGQGINSLTGDATWVHRFYPDSRWNAPGGDYQSAASGETLVDFAGVYTWQSTSGMVADAQLWLDQPAINFGWMVLSPGAGSRSARRFDTRESPFLELRPRLLLTFSPRCFADFNLDGGVDGDDVDAFFAVWQTGSEAADANGDGGVDGTDVDAFFVQWVAGGC